MGMDRASDNVAPPAVIKIGGALVTSDLSTFWLNVGELRLRQPVVIVHGGGPEATRVAKMLGHEPEIVQGRRVTTQRDLEVIEWVARGELNTRLVGQAMAAGLRAVGLSGVDGAMIVVRKRPPWTIEGRNVDFGFVGDVESVNTELLDVLLRADFTPIVAPLGADGSGQAYNVNADTVAREIAAAIGASRLLLVTETGNVRNAADGSGDALTKCDPRLYEEGISEGWIAGGMRVKLQVAFEALEAGIEDVCIVGPEDIADRSRATRVVL